MKGIRALLLLGLTWWTEVAAHKPMTNGVHCGAQFSTQQTALQVPTVNEFWGTSRVVTCDGPVLWANFTVFTDTVVEITAGSLHPATTLLTYDRFADLRAEILILDSSLPPLDRASIEIDLPESATHGQLFSAPADISNCLHSQNLRPGGWAHPTQGICGFYDTFGNYGVYSSVHVDDKVAIKLDGAEYKNVSMVVWFRGQQTGKLWTMVGTWGTGQTDLSYKGGVSLPSGHCDCLGEWDQDFYETKITDPSLAATVVPNVAACPAEPPSYGCPAHTGAGGDGMVGGMDGHGGKGTGGGGEEDGEEDGGMDGHDMGGEGGGMDAHDMGGMHDMVMGCGGECPVRTKLEATGMKMHSGMAIEFECDVAVDFVRGMIPHHLGAVHMCDDMRNAQESTDLGLVHFCTHVAYEQTYEVEIMIAWLKDYGRKMGPEYTCGGGSMGCGDLSCDSSKAFLAANHKMHQGMAVHYTCDAELDFVQGMIPHHQGAVDMCAVLLEDPKVKGDPEYAPTLVDLCHNITYTQNAEMTWMVRWLRDTRDVQTVGASCFEGVQVAEVCSDMLLITDACHAVGADNACWCDDLPCNEQYTVGAYSFQVNEFCSEKCGVCTVPTAAQIMAELLAMDHGDMDHGDMDHDDHGEMDHDDHGDMDHDDHGDMEHDDHGDMEHDDHGDMEHDDHGDMEHDDHGDMEQFSRSFLDGHEDHSGHEDHDGHADDAGAGIVVGDMEHASMDASAAHAAWAPAGRSALAVVALFMALGQL